MNDTSITDLSPLKGSPLEKLSMQQTGVTELSPLLTMPKLTELRLSVKKVNVEVLRSHPTLKFIGDEDAPLRPVAAFWADYDAERQRLAPALAQVRAALPALGLKDSPSILQTSPQGVRLNAMKSGIKDLSPLRGLSIAFLDLDANPFTDISPLRGLPLVWLSLGGSKVTDISPLLDCPTLESIMLPKGVTNVELLKKLPKLRYISDEKFDLPSFQPGETAAEFWQRYDAQKAAERK